MKKRIISQVAGRVQMVMYRDFTTRRARSLGLVGSVKNMQDGSVLVIAEGEESILLVFIEALKKGSLFARVDRVSVEWKDATGEFVDFTISY
jgi:acylphosphatase